MDTCIFCNIAQGNIPSQRVYEDDRSVAFLDIHPKAPGHTLLIPKEHYQWFDELPDDLSDHLFRVAKQLAREFKQQATTDYVHLSIVGKDVPHVHIHLIPRKLSEHVE